MSSHPSESLFDSTVRVVCFGDRSHGDDAFGCHVHDALRTSVLPPHVTLHEAGTPGLGGVLFFEGCTRAIIVDAIGPSRTPGRLRRLTLEQARHVDWPLSNHAQGLGYLLSALPLALDDMPELTIVGVDICEPTAYRESLSPCVRDCVEPAIEMIRELLDASHETLYRRHG